MTGVLQLCCSSASISLRGPSAEAVSPKVPVKCQRVSRLAARSWTLQVAAGSLWLDHLRASFHLLHNSTGFHGLILDPNLLERKGSQASVNTMRWNLQLFHEHIKNTEDFVRCCKESGGAGRAPVAPRYFHHNGFGKIFHTSVIDICMLARERRAVTGRAGFWRGRKLSKMRRAEVCGGQKSLWSRSTQALKKAAQEGPSSDHTFSDADCPHRPDPAAWGQYPIWQELLGSCDPSSTPTVPSMAGAPYPAALTSPSIQKERMTPVYPHPIYHVWSQLPISLFLTILTS